MAQSPWLPLRWSGALPAGDLAPLNCLYGGGEGLPVLTADDLKGVQIPKRALWPSVRVSVNGAAEAGPTGAPWVNANGWLIRMLRFRDPTRPVLLDTKPAAARPASQVLAVADAMAYGASWVVTHSPETWPQVRVALQFFERKAEWRGWQPVAALTVIGDFAGANEGIGGECLNLLTRRQVGFRLAAPGDVAALGNAGAAAWVSTAPVPMEKYLPWIRGGGTLIVHGEANSRVEGKGRIIGRPEPWNDAYAAVAGIHLALTRRTDVLRLWNAGSFNTFYQTEPHGNRGVVQLINYAVNAGSNDTSIWLARPWKKAVLTTFEKQMPLKTTPSNGGIEIPLAPLGVYAAIELEA
ncbi:MAG: hypothetical protein ACKV2U_23845 [Bryobacteraceae bacterium]